MDDVGLREAGDRRDSGARSGVQDDLRSNEDTFANPHPKPCVIPPVETRVPFDQPGIVAPVKTCLNARAATPRRRRAPV